VCPSALPAVQTPESNRSMDQKVPSIIKAVSLPVTVMTSAATVTTVRKHLVGSQKRKARKQRITRLDPEKVGTFRGKLKV
jgi:hypothetical protein